MTDQKDDPAGEGQSGPAQRVQEEAGRWKEMGGGGVSTGFKAVVRNASNTQET